MAKAMQCPGCGLYHPARYDQCVSCGHKLDGTGSGSLPIVAPHQQGDRHDDDDEDDDEEDDDDERPKRRNKKAGKKSSRPKLRLKSIPIMWIVAAAGFLLASAGGIFFFMSRPPESDRLLDEGQKELANGQYAFAQKTLEQAARDQAD